MDTKKLRTAVKKLQGPLIINHLILTVQILMFAGLRTAFSVFCTSLTALACGAVWVAVYRRFKQL